MLVCLLSLILIALLLCAGYYWNGAEFYTTLSANEWGDVLSGLFGTAAFIFLAYTAFLQKKELTAQRQQLDLQREEMKSQRLELERGADQQTKLAFFQLLLAVYNAMDDQVLRACWFARLTDRPLSGGMTVQTPIDFPVSRAYRELTERVRAYTNVSQWIEDKVLRERAEEACEKIISLGDALDSFIDQLRQNEREQYKGIFYSSSRGELVTALRAQQKDTPKP